MRFYCVQSSYKDGTITTLELDGLHILFGCPLNLSKLINYLPNFGHFLDDRLHDTTLIKQNLGKPVSSTVISKIQSDDQASPDENDYYIKIHEKYYMKTPIKYDVSPFDNIDLTKIDCILISNLDNLYALPYITEYTKFKGTIYATTPVSQISQHLLRELHELTEFRNKKRTIHSEDFFQESEFYELFEDQGLAIQDWLDIYSLKDIENSFAKIVQVNYNEIIQLNTITSVQAICSGYSLGSCNWLFQVYNNKIGYISRTSLSGFRHCLPSDIEKLKDSKVLIVEDIINYMNSDYTAANQADSYEVLVSNFVTTVSRHINSKNSGNILIPISNLVFLLDLVDIFKQKISGFGALHIISSSFDALMAYANSNFEYLNTTLMSKIFTQNPENPFTFESLEKTGRFFVYNSIDEFQERNTNQNYGLLDSGMPSIYIMPHSSLRLGFSSRFLDIFEKEQNNLIPLLILTDPYIQTIDFFGPIITKKTKVIRCPLDGNISIRDISRLFKLIKPETLILPEKYKMIGDKDNLLYISVHNKTNIMHYAEDEELDINIPGALIPVQIAQGELNAIDKMKDLKFDYNTKFKIHKIEFKLKKKSDGQLVITNVKEDFTNAKKTVGDKGVETPAEKASKLSMSMDGLFESILDKQSRASIPTLSTSIDDKLLSKQLPILSDKSLDTSTGAGAGIGVKALSKSLKLYMKFNYLDTAVDNFCKALEKLGYSKLKFQKLPKLINEDVCYQIIFHKDNHYELIAEIGSKQTQLYFSLNFTNEMKANVKKILAEKFSVHFLVDNVNIFSEL